MKKIGLIVLICAFVVSANSQSLKVQSAYNYMRPSSLQLDKAKENIDAACVHESTMNDSKAWRYKALIYCLLADAKYVNDKDPMYDKLKKYKNLSDNPVEIAYEALQKSMELDKEKEDFLQENKATLAQFGYQFLREGIDQYQNKKYTESLSSFEKSKAVSVETNQMKYACMAAEYAASASKVLGDNEKALSNYNFIISVKGRANDTANISVFTNAYDLYMAKNDSVGAEKVIQRAAKFYSDSVSIVTRQVNVYLKMGKKDEARKALDALAAKDPNNYVVYSAIGDIERQNGNEEAAEINYQKSLALNPSFNAYYNLGVQYYNVAVENSEKSDKAASEGNIDDMEKYDNASREALKKAYPYFENAIKQKSNLDDFETLKILKKIYAKLEMKDDFNRIDTKLKQQSK